MYSYKNPAIIPLFQSLVALTENLQNRQNLVVPFTPRYTTRLSLQVAGIAIFMLLRLSYIQVPRDPTTICSCWIKMMIFGGD